MCHFSDESCGQTWTQYSLTFCWRSAHLSGRRRFWSCPWFQRRAELQTDARTETGYGLWHHMWTRQHHYWPTLCNMDCVQTDLSTFKVWDFQGRFCSSAVSMLVLKSYGLINSPALSFSSKFNRLNPSLKFQACRGRCLIKTNKPFCLSRLLWSWIFSSWTSKIFTVPFSQPAWETHTPNTHTHSFRNVGWCSDAADGEERVWTYSQHGALSVAADGPHWSTKRLHTGPGLQVFQVILCDLTVQTSSKEPMVKPTQCLCSSAVFTWNHLQQKNPIKIKTEHRHKIRRFLFTFDLENKDLKNVIVFFYRNVF